MRTELAHIQQQGSINHGQEIYCVKLASSVSMLDADRVCSSDRGVVSHLSMPPLVHAVWASRLPPSPSPLLLFLPFSLFPFFFLNVFFYILKMNLLLKWI